MTFALQDVKLLDHIMRSTKQLRKPKEVKNNDKERKDGIFQWWKEIQDFNLDIRKLLLRYQECGPTQFRKKFLL